MAAPLVAALLLCCLAAGAWADKVVYFSGRKYQVDSADLSRGEGGRETALLREGGGVTVAWNRDAREWVQIAAAPPPPTRRRSRPPPPPPPARAPGAESPSRPPGARRRPPSRTRTVYYRGEKFAVPRSSFVKIGKDSAALLPEGSVVAWDESERRWVALPVTPTEFLEAASAPSRLTVEVSFGRVKAVKAGPPGANRTLVGLPGFASRIDSWGPVVDAVSRRGYRVCLVDMASNEALAPETTARDPDEGKLRVDEVVRACISEGTRRSRSAIVLSGFGFGANLAGTWASENPGAVDALVLFSPLTRSPPAVTSQTLVLTARDDPVSWIANRWRGEKVSVVISKGKGGHVMPKGKRRLKPVLDFLSRAVL